MINALSSLEFEGWSFCKTFQKKMNLKDTLPESKRETEAFHMEPMTKGILGRGNNRYKDKGVLKT